MKKDYLEQYIAEHRAKFDTEIPPLKVWYQIEKEMRQQEAKRRRMQTWRLARVAAAVVLLLLTGGIIGSILTSNSMETTAVATSNIPTELQETELYYQQQLAQKLQQLAAYENQSPKIIADLEESNQVIAELKAELSQIPEGTEQIVINHIIKTYQLKLDVLERVLENLEQSNIQKQKQHERNI
ncbi:MAG: hypothetical protein AAF849_12535 [Bacteroidota bacterium]